MPTTIESPPTSPTLSVTPAEMGLGGEDYRKYKDEMERKEQETLRQQYPAWAREVERRNSTKK